MAQAVTLARLHGTERLDAAAIAIKRIMRADIIVIDDVGLLPVTTETAETLYRVVSAAYEKRSITLSGNLHPAGFDELMPKTIANAIVDRLLHHTTSSSPHATASASPKPPPERR